MIKLCSMCFGINIDELKKELPSVIIEDDCIGECGSMFTAYVGDDMITATSLEDFIEQYKNQQI